jgi:hypothetical protein
MRAMKERYRLFLRRKSFYYAFDNTTKTFQSLKTKDEAEAIFGRKPGVPRESASTSKWRKFCARFPRKAHSFPTCELCGRVTGRPSSSSVARD